MPINPSEELECWRYLANLKNTGVYEQCIVVADFNIIRNTFEKKRRDLWERSLLNQLRGTYS